MQDRPLHVHVGIVLVVTGLFATFQVLRGGLPLPEFTVDSRSLVPTVLAGLLALAAAGAALARTRLELLVFLGLLGLLIALLYSFFSAPDLALTQLLTETVLLLLMVTVLRKLPPRSPGARRVPRFALPVAVLGGAVVTAVVLKAKAIEFAPPVSGFFAENSLSKAYGANVVNVILVDFRALDTLGEITVLGIAAVGAMALIRRRIQPFAFDPTRSPLLSSAVRLMLPALGLFAAFLFLRGHNNPGGGFISALVAATAAGFVHLSCVPSRPGRVEARLIGGGLALATLSGVLAVAAGKPFLTGLWWHGELPGGGALHLGTPLLFDAGVFLAVLGFALSFLRRLLPTHHTAHSWN
jgi:multisubunit Na+/H+ antiporter MnhB subunit